MGSAESKARSGELPRRLVGARRAGTGPFYEAAFDAIGVGNGTNLLDVGCGAGLALQLAEKRGAAVSGLDAAEGFLAVARGRVPDRRLAPR